MELMIGCGKKRQKTLVYAGKADFEHLVTLDFNEDHNPDVVWDLNNIPLPFEADSFDEIHAMEVLEHCGSQGDFIWFFEQWSDFWRILKPNAVFVGTVPHPSSPWAWGDPSHKRVIPPESFVFLVQPEYTAQVGKTPMSDFRRWYRADFDILHLHVNEHGLTEFVLRAVKPSRISI